MHKHIYIHTPHVSYLSDEACAHRVRVECYLFAESSSCRHSFFDWATPVQLSAVLCPTCSLIAFFTNSWA